MKDVYKRQHRQHASFHIHQYEHCNRSHLYLHVLSVPVSYTHLDVYKRQTPAMLSDIVDELKEVLEHQPATKDKEQKKALREKKKQVRDCLLYTSYA